MLKMERLLRPNNAIDYKTTPLKKLHMQVYQFTNGQETYLVEARNIYTKHLRENRETLGNTFR